MAKCKNCEHLGYLFDGDKVGKRVWCGNIADSPVLDMERDCEYYVPQTNADRIRNMTDEELAELLYSLQTEDLDGMFCKTEDKCEEMMDSGDEIPKSMCKQCLVKWLRSESEG